MVQAYYESLGYITDRARPQAQTIAGGRTIFLAYDFLRAFDVIGIGPEGQLYAQVTMAETRLSDKRKTIESFPWTSKAGANDIVRADVVYVERVNHPLDKRRKAWRFTFQRFDIEKRTWYRRGSDETLYVLWDSNERCVIPQAML